MATSVSVYPQKLTPGSTNDVEYDFSPCFGAGVEVTIFVEVLSGTIAFAVGQTAANTAMTLTSTSGSKPITIRPGTTTGNLHAKAASGSDYFNVYY